MIKNRFVPLLCLSLIALPQIGAAMTPGMYASCHKQGAELQARQLSLQKRAQARLDQLAETEAAGDVWEEAERLRNYGKAAEADAARRDYEALKADLQEKEIALQADLADLNLDVGRYNQACAPVK